MHTVTMTLWQVMATVNGRQVPTFYLDKQVQGILDETSAERIARDIVTIASDNGNRVIVTVMEINYTVGVNYE